MFVVLPLPCLIACIRLLRTLSLMHYYTLLSSNRFHCISFKPGKLLLYFFSPDPVVVGPPKTKDASLGNDNMLLIFSRETHEMNIESAVAR